MEIKELLENNKDIVDILVKYHSIQVNIKSNKMVYVVNLPNLIKAIKELKK